MSKSKGLDDAEGRQHVSWLRLMESYLGDMYTRRRANGPDLATRSEKMSIRSWEHHISNGNELDIQTSHPTKSTGSSPWRAMNRGCLVDGLYQTLWLCIR